MVQFCLLFPLYQRTIRTIIRIDMIGMLTTRDSKINAAMFTEKRAIKFTTPKTIQKRRNGPPITPNSNVQFRCRSNQFLSLRGAVGWWTYLCFSSKSKPVSLCPHRGQNFIPSIPAFPQLGQYFINNSTIHFATLTGYFNMRRLLTMASKSSSHSLNSSGNVVQVTLQIVLFTIQHINT